MVVVAPWINFPELTTVVVVCVLVVCGRTGGLCLKWAKHGFMSVERIKTATNAAAVWIIKGHLWILFRMVLCVGGVCVCICVRMWVMYLCAYVVYVCVCR